MLDSGEVLGSEVLEERRWGGEGGGDEGGGAGGFCGHGEVE